MRDLRAALVAVGLGSLCACSGGGGSATQPQANPTPGGAGTAAVFNAKITFTIDVPALPAAATASARRRPGAIATTPYVSPLTGSVLLTLAEVNGVSPQQAAPAIAPVNVPASCQGSSAGCTIPVANVPAALGVDRYFVQTYTGSNAMGSLISTGFVDVTVPLAGKPGPAIGSAAAISIGGFVNTITLAPASLSFVEGTPSNAAILVQALDAGGATIVGAAQYATPITVTVGDTKNFALNGAASVAVAGPLQTPLTLHYGGGSSFGALVQATSQDGSGNAVNATPITATVLPPGSSPTSPPPIGAASPTPAATSTAAGSPSPTANPASPLPTGLRTPTPTAKPTPTPPPLTPLSLYVADAQADTVSEYRIASQLAAGTVPNPTVTPSRVFGFVPSLAKSSAIGNAGLSCGPDPLVPSGNGNGTAGVAVDPASGTTYVLPNCSDGNNTFIFGYPPQAVGTPAPTLYDPFPLGFGQPDGLGIANATVYAAYTSSSEALFGFGLNSNGSAPTVALGTACYQEFGNPSPGCFGSYASGFGLDSSGFFYLPGWWIDTPLGDAALLNSPAAILTMPALGSNPNVAPFSAITGLNSNVGGSGQAAAAATVDGSTLYVLSGIEPLGPAASSQSQVSYFPGLSACPPPSANAPINAVVPADQLTTCADGAQHWYLAGYSLNSQVLGPAANGTDVDLIPNFLIGGDTVGGFGCAFNLANGQYLAASGGYVYVINITPTCPDGSGIVAPEIDVYNTNGVSGAHTDIAPVLKLPLTAGFPSAVTIAPAGTVTGGQALLRRPLARPFRPNLYGRRVLRRPLHRTYFLRRP